MGFWDWLFGKAEQETEENAKPGAAASVAPPPVIASAPPPPPAVASVPPPGMQQIQVSVPAAVPSTYGIQRAIELMRALPLDDDPALVLRVVRKTLKASGVALEDIITSAKAREIAVVQGIDSDRAAIEQLQIQIATRNANIKRLEADLEETQSVRARLEEALSSETQVGKIAPEEILRIQKEAAAAARSQKS